MIHLRKIDGYRQLEGCSDDIFGQLVAHHQQTRNRMMKTFPIHSRMTRWGMESSGMYQYQYRCITYINATKNCIFLSMKMMSGMMLLVLKYQLLLSHKPVQKLLLVWASRIDAPIRRSFSSTSKREKPDIVGALICWLSRVPETAVPQIHAQ